MASTHPTPDAIRKIVEEVLRRLAKQPLAPPVSPRPLHPDAVHLTDKVVTLHVLEKLPSGTQLVAVWPHAIITPSARDFAKEAGILIQRNQSKHTSAAARLFVIAHADCHADAARRCSAIARAVAGSQQLPASGLTDIITAMATHASHDGARAVLLTGRPATAVVLANRSYSLRAASAHDAGALLLAAKDCVANLLIVDPKHFSIGSLERICIDFVNRDFGPVPAELSIQNDSTDKPCACSGHAH